MPLRIFHLYGNKDNLGDWGSAEGVKQMIRLTWGEVHFTDFFISYADLSDSDISHINRNHDLVVIGGGGLLYPRSRGLLLRLTQESLKKISVPIILYAIGLNYEPRDEERACVYLRRFAKAKGLFSLISVRDEFTRDRLWKLGIKTELVPCPSMFLGECMELFDLPDDDRRKAGIVPVPFGRFASRQRQLYLQSISSLVAKNKNNFSFFLIGHHKQIDHSYDILSASTQLPIIYPVNPWQLMRAYGQMDFFIGSRGHMGIFAVGAGKPFIFLSYNVKCPALTEMMNYPKQLTIDPKEFDVFGLGQSFKKMIDSEKILSKLLLEKKEVFKQNNENYVRSIPALEKKV